MTANEIKELTRRVSLLEQQVTTIVAELRARKVLPPQPPGKKVRVRMSPAARVEQRRQLLADARKNRWVQQRSTANPKKPKSKSKAKRA